jgi:hypothetical protein
MLAFETSSFAYTPRCLGQGIEFHMHMVVQPTVSAEDKLFSVHWRSSVCDAEEQGRRG